MKHSLEEERQILRGRRLSFKASARPRGLQGGGAERVRKGTGGKGREGCDWIERRG